MGKSYADVLLVIPAAPDTMGRREERLGVGYLAGILRHVGHRVRIVDSQAMLGQAGYRRDAGVVDPTIVKHEFGTLAGPLVEKDWDLIGFSVLTSEVESCAKLIDFLKSEGSRAHIAIGGESPTIELRWIFDDIPGVDSVVLGEGEMTLLELVDAVLHQKDWHKVPGLAWKQGGQIYKSPPRPRIEDLDLLPYPDRQTLPAIKRWQPMANITSSRNCVYRCAFCSVRQFWGGKAVGWKQRRNAAVLDEMAYVQRRFDVNDFTFTDPLWMGAGRRGRKAAAAFAQELIERDLGVNFRIKVRADTLDRELISLLLKAGLFRVGIGVESVWQPTLDFWNKDIDVKTNLATVEMIADAGVDMDLGFIMFHPLITLDEFDANVQFLRHWLDRARRPGLTDLYAFYTRLIVYRNISIEKKLRERGLLDSHNQYTIVDPRVAEIYHFLWSEIRVKIRPLYYPLITWEMIAKKLRMETGEDAEELKFGEVVRSLSISLAELCISTSHSVRKDGGITRSRIDNRLKDFEKKLKESGLQISDALTRLGWS